MVQRQLDVMRADLFSTHRTLFGHYTEDSHEKSKLQYCEKVLQIGRRDSFSSTRTVVVSTFLESIEIKWKKTLNLHIIRSIFSELLTYATEHSREQRIKNYCVVKSVGTDDERVHEMQVEMLVQYSTWKSIYIAELWIDEAAECSFRLDVCENVRLLLNCGFLLFKKMRPTLGPNTEPKVIETLISISQCSREKASQEVSLQRGFWCYFGYFSSNLN